MMSRADNWIPVCSVDLSGNERRYLNQCIDHAWISSSGPFVRRFEEEFARHLGVSAAVTCSSGTAAIHLALRALNVGHGDEVIVPTLTMIATGNAVLYCGATPVVVDVDPVSGNVTPETVEGAITSKTRAVLPVHLYGWPCDMPGLRAVTQSRNIALVEDAAEAIGTIAANCPAGSLGELGCFSFFANKAISTGEGGMVVTNNTDLAMRLRRLRDQWFVPERRFVHPEVGFNYRMTNLQAAVGVAQLERVEELVEKRLHVARTYRKALEDIPEYQWPESKPSDGRNSHWMAALRLRGKLETKRDKLSAFLKDAGIDSRDFFVPLHRQPVFEAIGQRPCPVSDRLSRQGILLPTGPALSNADLDRISKKLRQFARDSR